MSPDLATSSIATEQLAENIKLIRNEPVVMVCCSFTVHIFA